MKNTLNKDNQLRSTNGDLYELLTTDLLLKVNKPTQYLGNEWGHLIDKKVDTSLKSWEETKVRTAIVYPDLYELGLANFGIKILYQILNSHKDFLCDRAYAPMSDMENILRERKIPLWGWETYKPLNQFDMLGISLSYELSYSNVLNLLEINGLELFSKDRKDIFPLIFAGGPTTFNPEPMAEFLDFYIIGDGEEVLIEISETIKTFKDKCSNLNDSNKKEELLIKLANIPGVYVPRFYTPDENNNYLPVRNKDYDVPEKIAKRVVSLTDKNQPVSGLIPYLSTVHDRQVLEIRRGCDRGCRFCQPGYAYLPVRERTPENLVELSKKALKNTGYDEYSLLSLSASDYTKLHEVSMKLNKEHSKDGISLSMPSQRADRFDMAIANEINVVRKSGITLAPEAGTERLRQVINKGLKESDIRTAIENVYDSGYKSVKLYFMIGLPTETFEDLDGILNLLKWMSDLSKIKKKRPLNITCTISTFVPKAFTPFQWFSQDSTIMFNQKIQYLKDRLRELKLRNVKLNCTDPKFALLEALLSRGDRRLSKVIFNAFKKGAKFDAWGENINLDLWDQAGKLESIDIQNETTKHREIGSDCPWEIIDSGLLKKFMVEEIKKALSETETAACTEDSCHACGVCFDLNVLNEVSTDRSKGNKFVKVIEEKENKKVEEKANNIPNEKAPEKSKTKHNNLPSNTAEKIEIIHSKTGEMKFISHLDLQRLFERALRRAGIPFSFTAGFNPRPKFKWISPLPLFYESDHERLHIELYETTDNADLQVRLSEQLPPEIRIISVNKVSLTEKLPHLENVKTLYNVQSKTPLLWEEYISELQLNIEEFLQKDSQIIKVTKKNKDRKYPKIVEKEIDIRSLVNGIKVLNQKPLEIELNVAGNCRPEVILNQVIPKKFYKTNEELKNKWQLDWEITKKDLIV